MSLELSLSNLWFYSLQTGILILAAGLLVRFLRLREPRSLYLFWRVLLAVCLLLGFQPGVPDPLSDPVPVPPAEELTLPVSPVTVSETDQAADVFPVLGVLFVAGILLRLIWLGNGFYRLHRLRRRTRRLVLPPHLQPLTGEMRVSSRFRVSSEVTGPVTFGWFRPVIIFPDSFAELDPAMQKAVACHELLHVKRRDWVWNTFEELVRTVFWFHPGFYWLIGRIQLTREQVVDEQAVGLLGSRKTYLHSLVEIARWKNSAASVPAPLFLRECQFSRRVRHLIQLREVRMSKNKSTVFWSFCVALLLATGWWSLAALPLTATPPARMPQEEPAAGQPVRVGSRVMANKLVHQVDPEIPGQPGSSRPLIQFILSIVIDKNGEVQRVEVLQGDEAHPPSNSAVADAVKQWRYEPFLLDGKPVPVRTTVFLLLPRAEPVGTTGSHASPHPEPAFDEPIHVGTNIMADKLIHRVDPEIPSGLEGDGPLGLIILSVVVGKNGKVQQVTVVRGDKGDPRLDSAAVKAVKQWRYEPYVYQGKPITVRTTILLRMPKPESAVEEPVRVGGRVMESHLIHRVDPEFSTELKEARPSGQVILSIVIGKNGEVQQVEVLKGDEGDPGLNSAAANAVSQWRYKPFLLNGIPVPVKATVVVRFLRDASVPQSVNLNNETRSQIRHRLDSALKEVDRATNEMRAIDMTEFRSQLGSARKELERARSKLAGIDMKELRHRFEMAQKKLERARSEMAEIDVREFRRKLQELEKMIEREE
ncbi:MAG: TonB family protein [Acidobacteriota bacterium]|nr:TonB family protein [Acidobacteriota bacterium]